MTAPLVDPPTELAQIIQSVTDRWDEPLDEVHDIPQIVDAILAAGWRPPEPAAETFVPRPMRGGYPG